MTTQDARDYFKNKKLSYSDIMEGDILSLVILINRNLKRYKRESKYGREMGMYLSSKMVIKKNRDGSIIKCFLYVNSSYFTRRHCLEFEEDGRISFMGWADTKNSQPVLKAFTEWCDIISH